jgi:SAM-dependent methyltransferase
MATASSTFTAASGDGYELQMGRWSRRLAEPFLDFCGYRDGETVLDAGCGTGSLTFALAQRAKASRIQAIDYSPAYVAHAARHNGNANIAFKVGDVCALPFADASFDRVLSLLVLHFVPQTVPGAGSSRTGFSSIRRPRSIRTAKPAARATTRDP